MRKSFLRCVYASGIVSSCKNTNNNADWRPSTILIRNMVYFTTLFREHVLKLNCRCLYFDTRLFLLSCVARLGSSKFRRFKGQIMMTLKYLILLYKSFVLQYGGDIGNKRNDKWSPYSNNIHYRMKLYFIKVWLFVTLNWQFEKSSGASKGNDSEWVYRCPLTSGFTSGVK